MAKINYSARYGAVEINKKGEIEVFLDKEEGSREGLINASVYIFNKEIFPKLIGKGFYGMPAEGFLSISEFLRIINGCKRTLKSLKY